MNPDIAPHKYVRARHIHLAESLTDKVKIYLDTKYWILFRDVTLGREQDQSLVDLLRVIRDAVLSGQVICPISQDSFSECFVQDDAATLKATVQLMDQLSLGICLTEFNTRINAELWHFMIEKAKGKDAVIERRMLMWTKAGYVLGYVEPESEIFSKDQSNAVKKAIFDQLWEATFLDIFDGIGSCPDWKVKPNAIDSMNEGKFASNGDFSSFKELFMIELAGGLELLQEPLSEILFQMYLSEYGKNTDPNCKPEPEAGKQAANIIYHAFRLNKISDELPTLRTHIALHAALRWDRQRKYKPNDLYDLRHAAMALPYCDVFLTEKPLCHLIHEKHSGITDQLPCKSFSDANVALEHINNLI
ncbi:MAG: hypothetical protein AAF711_06410 [Planctomycetota bacterium]